MILDIIAQFWYVWAFFVGFFVVRRTRKKDLVETKNILIIGHKGAAGHAYQNSIDSFKKVRDLKIDYIECDIRRSVDGVFFLAHDDKLKSNKGKVFTISKTRSSELANTKLKNGTNLVRIEEYIELFPKNQKLYFDLKLKSCEFDFLDILKKYKLIDRCVVTSFYADSLRLLKVLEPNLVVGLSFPKDRFCTLVKLALSPLWMTISYLIRYTFPFYVGILSSYAKSDFITVQFRVILSKRLIKSAHKHGLMVFAFTVNRKRHIKKMIKWGVDGIISDYPDRVKEIINNK